MTARAVVRRCPAFRAMRRRAVVRILRPAPELWLACRLEHPSRQAPTERARPPRAWRAGLAICERTARRHRSLAAARTAGLTKLLTLTRRRI